MDSDTVCICIPDKEVFIPLLRLVLGGMAMRKNVCYDDLDDLQLAVDDLLANRRPNGGQICMTVRVEGCQLDITVEAVIDDELCKRLEVASVETATEEEPAVLDTCRLLHSLMDGYEVQELSAGRYSIRMTKTCG
ncbi:MAG: hypothetical protein GX604_10330 [Actinobacteria bacterium]|nr:hypothetical protein [Actinomycetota bacterium]